MFIAPEPVVPQNPCEPSPCGPNARCRVVNDAPSCSCSPEFIGTPPNCRPECVSNSECSAQMACVNQKCRDPCPGSCGANADCRVVSHTPMCVCPSDYIGDPFTQCTPRPRKNQEIPLFFTFLFIGSKDFGSSRIATPFISCILLYTLCAL